jgi:hypothetical protein
MNCAPFCWHLLPLNNNKLAYSFDISIIALVWLFNMQSARRGFFEKALRTKARALPSKN